MAILRDKQKTIEERNEEIVSSKDRVYILSVENEMDIANKESNIEYALSDHQKLSNTSESLKSELGIFLKDFTFTDDIIHKRREWL